MFDSGYIQIISSTCIVLSVHEYNVCVGNNNEIACSCRVQTDVTNKQGVYTAICDLPKQNGLAKLKRCAAI